MQNLEETIRRMGDNPALLEGKVGKSGWASEQAKGFEKKAANMTKLIAAHDKNQKEIVKKHKDPKAVEKLKMEREKLRKKIYDQWTELHYGVGDLLVALKHMGVSSF